MAAAALLPAAAGKTHKFYASMGKNIANKEIQLTIQGQTVSSNFGTIDTAQYNIEQLLHAGISNDLFSSQEMTLQEDEEELLQELAEESYTAYSALKNHPYFLQYLNEVSPLRFYSETNIASRPTKRKNSGRLEVEGSAGHSLCRFLEPVETKCNGLLWRGQGAAVPWNKRGNGRGETAV